MNVKPVSVLLVEDDLVDARAVERAFSKHRIANPIVHAMNGTDALAVLRGADPDRHIERPYIVLLDLNMPVMGGHEFLAALRADEQLRDTVVFVLTTSSADEDIRRAYDQNVAGYLVKSRIAEDFADVASLVDIYWRAVVFPSDE